MTEQASEPNLIRLILAVHVRIAPSMNLSKQVTFEHTGVVLFDAIFLHHRSVQKLAESGSTNLK